MGSFENKIKSFERRYGIHLRSLRRSRKFTTLLTLFILFILIIMYKYATFPVRHGLDKLKSNDCLKDKLTKYSNTIDTMNTVVSDSPLNPDGEHVYVPFTGNGYIGVSLNSDKGIYGNHDVKSLNLGLKYNPLSSVSLDNTWNKNEVVAVEILSGFAHKIKCFQNDFNECITVTNTLYAHRTRPSLIIEEISLVNPTKETVSFDIVQIGAFEWDKLNVKNDIYKNYEYTISSGIINLKNDNKEKQVCLSIISTKLPISIQVKAHDINSKYNTLTIVKYSKTLLNTKSETLKSTVEDIEIQALMEFKNAVDVGISKLRQEHINAWNNIWNSGFSISKSLAANALNGDQINSTIYYILASNRAPLIEYQQQNNTNEAYQLSLSVDRCYEGFSTLQATKLWTFAKNEYDISDLNSLWHLTLMKNSCANLLKLGVHGILQAIILSIGGLKFSNHHLELNLNPKQLHRNFMFRNINYANITYFNVSVEVNDDDNHAKLYVTIDKINSNKNFYACDAGCIDEPIELLSKIRHELPVKLTNPLTSILYITDDKLHASQLKHILHVQEVEIAGPQNAQEVALHKHGHHLGGLSILFWILFVFLLVVFHLFLCKLIFRELFHSNDGTEIINSSSNNRYSRMRAV